jgi:hypothetical protein
VTHDSFTADFTSTQRSEGMNNVYKKRFRRKLCLSELLEECDKCSASLRENELDADLKSRQSDPITYIPGLPMLKTAAESYTRKIYLDFEKQFKEHFSFSCKLFQTEGTIMVYKVLPMALQHEAMVVFNSEYMSITCSCRMFESIGMLALFSKFHHINNTDYNTNYFIVGILCKHAIRVFNINEVFVLPTQYILRRWTKYAKR